MPRIRRVFTLGLVSLFAAGLLSTGCTKYADEEDLAQLENQRRAAASAEQTVQKKQAEKAELEKELADLEAELETAEAELELVRE